MLAQTAVSVIGVDIDAATLRHAQTYHRRENMHLIQADAHEPFLSEIKAALSLQAVRHDLTARRRVPRSTASTICTSCWHRRHVARSRLSGAGDCRRLQARRVDSEDVWLVFCMPHGRSDGRMPALVAGFTDHCWTVDDWELMTISRSARECRARRNE